ncbi:DUF481 domain-containing protein [Sphingomonas sp. KC8]|uniref:DUF481 domain-containing protein n=1 Tax=Sphingomonas sp. KC8 TaxID=1030157 RepID=UPI0002D2FB1B|nr:DUF481 domain-containing protein [Sphingomonas sp. KC8]ARS26560.1 hypothetical protein KC8_04555 [Sphingomonas sp. KC8]
MLPFLAFALLAPLIEPPQTAPAPPSVPPLLLTPIVAAPPPPAQPLPMPRIAPPPPTELPPSVRALLDAAIASDDPQTVSAIARLARKTAPWAANQADALKDDYNAVVAEKKATAERERIARLSNASFFDNWKGEVELGGSRSTGNTRALGLYGSAKGEREGVRVRHRFNARADLQETSGVTTTERILASYQPNLKFDDRFYAYGLGQYEHDRFLGYDNRYTLGGGFGYSLVSNDKMKLDFEGGPAVRYTDFIAEPGKTTIAGRASMALRWQIAPTVSLTQDAALYVESGSTNATSSIALDTKLFGPLKTRLSYNIQYERDAPAGRDPVDTLSRATLVYSF